MKFDPNCHSAALIRKGRGMLKKGGKALVSTGKTSSTLNMKKFGVSGGSLKFLLFLNCDSFTMRFLVLQRFGSVFFSAGWLCPVVLPSFPSTES